MVFGLRGRAAIRLEFQKPLPRQYPPSPLISFNLAHVLAALTNRHEVQRILDLIDDDAITFHAFRRTFATEARRQGADLDEIQKLGNWRNHTMPTRYIQLEDQRSAELLGKMARSFKSDTVADAEASDDAADTA